MLLRNTFFVPGSSPDSPAWMVSSPSILLRRPHFNPMIHDDNTFKLRLLIVALMLANLLDVFARQRSPARFDLAQPHPISRPVGGRSRGDDHTPPPSAGYMKPPFMTAAIIAH